MCRWAAELWGAVADASFAEVQQLLPSGLVPRSGPVQQKKTRLRGKQRRDVLEGSPARGPGQRRPFIRTPPAWSSVVSAGPLPGSRGRKRQARLATSGGRAPPNPRHPPNLRTQLVEYARAGVAVVEHGVLLVKGRASSADLRYLHHYLFQHGAQACKHTMTCSGGTACIFYCSTWLNIPPPRASENRSSFASIVWIACVRQQNPLHPTSSTGRELGDRQHLHSLCCSLRAIAARPTAKQSRIGWRNET